MGGAVESSASETDEKADQGESKEDGGRRKGRYGDGLFKKAVDQVAALEKQLGIYELDQFTPKTPRK
jgi:hypothetical protein